MAQPPVQQKRLNQRRKEVSTPYPKILQLWASQTVVKQKQYEDELQLHPKHRVDHKIAQHQNLHNPSRKPTLATVGSNRNVHSMENVKRLHLKVSCLLYTSPSPRDRG